MGIEVPPSSLPPGERLRRLQEFDDAVSGIPTFVHSSSEARAIRRMDKEELSGELADVVDLPEDLDKYSPANTLLALMRQDWSESTHFEQGLVINFTQRILDSMDLKVVRKDG